MDGTKIEWADATWNPITGCSRVSTGCEHCYAELRPLYHVGKKAAGRMLDGRTWDEMP